jgi:hypothetical protein
MMGENKKIKNKFKKIHVRKMYFPHLSRPPAPSLELWL